MSARPDHFVIPELCNTPAIALLVVFCQLLVIVLLFAGTELSWMSFGLMSLFVQWVALASAGVLCILRKPVASLNLVLGSGLAYLVVMLVTLCVSGAAEWILDRGPGMLLRVTGQMMISGIITGLVFRYFHVQQRLRLQEQAELQSRIQALQSRIRPHFLFNSMNIIASLIATDPETAEVVVEDLSELFRASLNDAGNQVPIDQELDLCERYLRIEALRLGDRLSLEWHVAELSPGTRIPLLTLQPLLENAIYHGIQPLPEGGTIELQLSYEEDFVVVRIANPVPPANQISETQGNRMALQNIRSRLAVLYDNKASLETGVSDDKFVTQLRFPKSPSPA